MSRDTVIDNLRGLAMFSMMMIHACSYYLKDKTVFLIWDSLQWAVPVFIFCSFYVFYSKITKFNSIDWLPYIKKRLPRLLIPYYYYLFFVFFLFFIFGRKEFNLDYFLAGLFIIKGIQFNWLVLLFIYLTFLMPLILLFKKNRFLYYGFFVLSVISSIYFIFKPFNFRLIMWLPWSTYAFFTIFFINNKSKPGFKFFIGFSSLIIFLILRIIEVNIGHNLSQFANKYPPTLYHLSFGIFWIMILYWLADKGFFNFLKFDRLLSFLSTNSYSLFFIHIIIIYLVLWTKTLPSNWFIFFLEIIAGSIIIQIFLKKITSFKLDLIYKN